MISKFIFTSILITSIIVGISLEVSEPNATHEDYSKYVQGKSSLPHITEKDSFCLARAIYYEAGNQSPIGKEAVAMVIINRVNHKRYPSSICKVVRQSTNVLGTPVCQFSYWCFDNEKPKGKMWEVSQEIARRVLTNYWDRDIISKLDSAIYYHADYVKPKWRHSKLFLGKIGVHKFYADQP